MLRQTFHHSGNSFHPTIFMTLYDHSQVKQITPNSYFLRSINRESGSMRHVLTFLQINQTIFFLTADINSKTIAYFIFFSGKTVPLASVQEKLTTFVTRNGSPSDLDWDSKAMGPVDLSPAIPENWASPGPHQVFHLTR